MAKTVSTPSGGSDPRRNTGSLPLPSSRRGLKGFLNEVGRELKKVSWPTKAETNRLTLVVLVVCIGVVAILSVMGLVFDTLIKILTRGTI